MSELEFETAKEQSHQVPSSYPSSKGFPKNSTAMRFHGYTKSGEGRCRACGASLEWWLSPAGHRMPMNPMPDLLTPAVSHFATCPEAGRFRNAKPSSKVRLNLSKPVSGGKP